MYTKPLQAAPAGIHSLSAKLNSGEEVSLGQYQGKVLLVVNTASRCTFTPQYAQLEALQQKYGKRGFSVLAFPSDDFGQQELPTDQEVLSFCENKFHISFPLFSKIHVKGPEQHPLFAYLSSNVLNGKTSAPPRWNFQKYLIHPQGYLVDYYYTFTPADSSRITRQIEKLLL